jgi:protein transport protein SEC23
MLRSHATVADMAFNGVLEVQVSKELRVCGAIGHVYSLAKKVSLDRCCPASDLPSFVFHQGPMVSTETEIGVGGTTTWRLPGLDQSTSVGVYLEVINQHTAQIPAGQRGLLQLLTHYQTAKGQRILRVTTVSHLYVPQQPLVLRRRLCSSFFYHSWVDPATGISAIAAGFDQEAAAVLTARLAVHKTETDDGTTADVLRWLDRLLIRLVFCSLFSSCSLLFALSLVST